MGDREVLDGLWDRLAELVARVRPEDRSRPTPWPGTDVGGLLSHLAAPQVAHGGWEGGPPDEALRRRLLGASCLDLYVHTYDLATALGEPVDLGASPALDEAWRYLSERFPRLRVAEHEVSGQPGALLLLVSGRGDPEHWRDRGALDWAGPAGEAFVRGARLLG